MSAISQDDVPGVCAHFEVIEGGCCPRDQEAIPCVVGRDIVIEPDRLGAFSLRGLPRRVDDLMLLAGAVAYADKFTRRQLGLSWGRRLHVTLPVLEPDFWMQRGVGSLLVGTLNVLTGDKWVFKFTSRREPLAYGRQAVLSFGDAPALVMPFSDGLDSLATARLTAAAEPGAGLILVTAGRVSDPDADWRVRHFKGRYHRVSVPFRLSRRRGAVRFREQSFRSRAFVFGVMAGLAAGLLGAERILVSESGQGTLGPSLTPVGNEAPDLRTHPAYTRSLAELLSLVLDRHVHFSHPNLWHTKGETLTKLKDAGLADDWWRTRSCARDARDVSHGSRRLQCGVCANCLLRRQSLMASGLGEHGDCYLWPRLASSDLAGAAVDAMRKTTRNDEQHAVCGVLAMAELAALDRPGQNRLALDWATVELAGVLDKSVATVGQSLRRLLGAHRQEWDDFVGAQGPASFAAQWAGHVLC